MTSIRIPTQKRAIEKKNNILNAALKLFQENGYYKTDTAKIAKEAKVSTGILYNYFEDKKQILIELFDRLFDNFEEPIINAISNVNPNNYELVLTSILEETIEFHHDYKTLHNELSSLFHTDLEIEKMYNEKIEDFIDKAANILVTNGFKKEHIHEKVHIMTILIETLNHQTVLMDSKCINQKALIEEIRIIIINLLK